MSDAISVECTHCHARLKLKSRSAVGKKVPCPKCKKPFVVAAPPEDEDDLGFMNVAEPDADEFAGLAEGDDEYELPTAPAARGKGKQGRKQKSEGSDGESTKLLLIGAGSIVAVGLLVAAGIVGIPLLADWLMAGNKIDTAWLPPDADVVVHARVSEAWTSPFVQSLISNHMVKTQLDVTWSKMGIDPTRVESITLGASGAAARMKEVAARGVPGMPGMPMGPPTAPSGSVPFVVVVRTKEISDLTKIKDKFKNGRTGTHQGAEYLIPPVGGDIALYFATTDTLVTGTEQSVKQAIEWGRKGVRRPDLDFVDPTQMVLIAFVPKDPSVFDGQSGGAGGPMIPGFSKSAIEATRGKVKGLCIGLSATDKLDLTVASNCTDDIAADKVVNATQTSITEMKGEFAKIKASIPPMFGEFVQLGDDILNSLQVSSTGAVVSTRASVPASVKSAVEKLPMLLMMGAMTPGQNPGGPPGMNPFSPPGAQGFSIPTDGQLPGNLPPGSVPPNGNPSLGGPPGTVPPGTIPPGTIPPGTLPPGTNLPNGGPPTLPPPGGNGGNR